MSEIYNKPREVIKNTRRKKTTGIELQPIIKEKNTIETALSSKEFFKNSMNEKDTNLSPNLKKRSYSSEIIGKQTKPPEHIPLIKKAKSFICTKTQEKIAEIKDQADDRLSNIMANDRNMNIKYSYSPRASAKNKTDKVKRFVLLTVLRVVSFANTAASSAVNKLVQYKSQIISAIAIATVIFSSFSLVWLALIIPLFLITVYLAIKHRSKIKAVIAFVKNIVDKIANVLQNSLKKVLDSTRDKVKLSTYDQIKIIVLLTMLFIKNNGESWAGVIMLPATEGNKFNHIDKSIYINSNNIKVVHHQAFKIFTFFNKLTKIRALILFTVSSIVIALSIAVVFIPSLTMLGTYITIMALPSSIIAIGIIILISMFAENLNTMLPTKFTRSFKKTTKYLGEGFATVDPTSSAVKASATVLLIGLFEMSNPKEIYSLEGMLSITPNKVMDRLAAGISGSLTAVQTLEWERLESEEDKEIFYQKIFLDKLEIFVQKNQTSCTEWLIQTKKFFNNQEFEETFNNIKNILFEPNANLSNSDIKDVSDKTMAYLIVQDIAVTTSGIITVNRSNEILFLKHERNKKTEELMASITEDENNIDGSEISIELDADEEVQILEEITHIMGDNTTIREWAKSELTYRNTSMKSFRSSTSTIDSEI